MKNRKLLIAVFLCFAMIITGVGYATLSGHLTISGTSEYNKEAAEDGFIENLIFSNATIVGGGSAQNDLVNDDATADAQTATFTVHTLATQGEYVTFTYTLTNENTVDAKITVTPQHDDTTNNPTTTFSYYEVTSVKVDTVEMSDTTTTESFTLGAGESTTVTVIVTLTQTPTTNVVPETYFLHLTATSVDQ